MSWIAPLVLPQSQPPAHRGRRGNAQQVAMKRAYAKRLHRGGKTLTEVAQEMGLARQTVHYYLNT